MHHLRLVDFFPFLSWIKGYGRRHVKADIVAGLTVAVVALPQFMAYALIAGLPVQYGLYASIVPVLKQILPATQESVDLIWVRQPGLTDEEKRQGKDYLERTRAWLDRCEKKGNLLLRDGDRPQDLIVGEARDDSVVVMGASLRHDVHHRVRGSLPLQVLSKT